MMSTQLDFSNIGSQASACAIAWSVIEVITVAIKFFSKYITKTRNGVDDWLVLPALLCSLGANSAIICKTIEPLVDALSNSKSRHGRA